MDFWVEEKDDCEIEAVDGDVVVAVVVVVVGEMEEECPPLVVVVVVVVLVAIARLAPGTADAEVP